LRYSLSVHSDNLDFKYGLNGACQETNMNKTTTRRKYLIFFAIGIISFYLSGYLLRGIHPPQSIYLMLLIYCILFGISILVCKERSRGFVLKAFAVSFAALFLISAGFFALSAHSHINSKAIDAERLQTIPDEFAVVTEEELSEYPALKEAITSQNIVQVNQDEWLRTSDYLTEKGSYTIKVGNEYYQIGFMTA
jgi:hypothetical protein